MQASLQAVTWRPGAGIRPPSPFLGSGSASSGPDAPGRAPDAGVFESIACGLLIYLVKYWSSI